MTHPAIRKTRELILAGDISSAETHLATIAETEGDRALVNVLEEMAPKDVLAIMREFDSSKESVVNLLVTPEQFVQAVVLERLYGETLEEYAPRLRSTMNAVMYRSADACSDVLDRLAEHDEGVRVLADYFTDHYDALQSLAIYGEFEADPDLEALLAPKAANTWDAERVDELDQGLEAGDAMELAKVRLQRSEAADSDWMETAWVLRHEFPDTFALLIEEIQQRLARAREEAAIQAQAPRVAPDMGDDEDDEESAI